MDIKANFSEVKAREIRRHLRLYKIYEFSDRAAFSVLEKTKNLSLKVFGLSMSFSGRQISDAFRAPWLHGEDSVSTVSHVFR